MDQQTAGLDTSQSTARDSYAQVLSSDKCLGGIRKKKRHRFTLPTVTYSVAFTAYQVVHFITTPLLYVLRARHIRVLAPRAVQ